LFGVSKTNAVAPNFTCSAGDRGAHEHNMPYLEKSIECAEVIDLESGGPSAAQMMTVLSHRLPYLYRHAYRLLGNRADAEDAAQDALLAAFKHLSQFRGEAQLSTWLTAIVMNCVRMQMRKRSRHIHISLESRIGEGQEYPLSEILVDDRSNPEDECHGSRLNARLMQSAEQLSPVLRRTFHLRFVDHLSTSETARVLGIPNGTVKAQTARARAKLMNSIGGMLHRSPGSRERRR